MSRAFRMVIMDVGRGQCILVQVPEGQDMLFGAGSSRPSEAQTAAGVLWARHVRSLDAIVVSRVGMERSGFLPLLARRFGVGHLVLPEAPEGDEQREAARRALGGRLVHVHELRDGRALTGGGLICEALHPDRRFARNAALSDNDRSLVLRCEYGELSFVLPADVGEAAMRRLTRDQPRKLRADMLVMPDHGAYAEGLEELLDSVRPTVAVVSGPRGGVAPRTLAALADRSIPLWITGRDGAVLLRFAGRQVELAGYASGRRMRFDPDLR
jgi:competence protein ComEC